MPSATVARPAGRRHCRLSPVTLALVLVVTALAGVGAPRPALAAPAYTTSELNLREGPGTWYAVILVMPAGAYVEIVEDQQDGFYRVRYDGVSGWAAAEYLDRGGGNDGGGGGGATVVTDALNLRAGPSTGDAVLAVMPYGSRVTLTGESANGFLSATYNGQAGWAYAAYLDTGGGTPAPSPSPAPGGETATVTSALNLRAEASTSSQVLAVMPAGASVTLTGDSANGFLSVSYNGTAGWAYAAYLETGGSTPAPGGEMATVTSELNLRAGPGTGYAVLTVMPAGAAVALSGEQANGFLGLTYSGMSGWASADYLSTSGDTPAPTPSPAPGGDSATTTSALNLRAGPSLGDAVLTVMPAGATVTVTGGVQNGFYPVGYAGSSGWASANYLSFGGTTPGPAPGGGSGIVWPFEPGTVWEVIQGYNGSSHQNRSERAQYYYALDFARVGGSTAGQPIYSPVSGTVRWTHAASGGIAIDLGNGYTLAMFHCSFQGWLGSGAAVEQGQYLGTISGPGGPGYAVTPHLDMTLWWTGDGGSGRSAAPFSGANAISGVAFPDVGGANQHYGTVVYP